MVYCSLAAVSSRNAASIDAHDVREQRDPLVSGVRRQYVDDGMRGAEEDALQRFSLIRPT